MKRKLVLENGTKLLGEGFGSLKERICEVVFNTSMVGYQEIISDPSYNEQFVVMTYPLIGNYGITSEDFETRFPSLGGLIVREINHNPSNFRSSQSVNDVMEEYDIVGISGIDTRKLTRIIRSEGSMKAIITDINTSNEEAISKLKSYTYPTNQVEKVSCKRTWHSKTSNAKFNVVAVDCGIKHSIISKLNHHKCNVTIVPYNSTRTDVLKFNPDGLFLSNGPGDPVNAKEVISLVKEMQGSIPIFGICLGHQVIALANNAKTYKLKFGHRGGNHPVKNLGNNKVEITSQNHSYAIIEESLKYSKLEITHKNILDQTIEGLANKEEKIFSVQYHPESAPGPEDSEYLFEQFISQMEGGNHNA